MKQFNPNATKLIARFVDKTINEEIEWEIDEIPSANIEAETIKDSENSTEIISDDESFRAVLYTNMYEGNIEVFNNETDEEITDFDIQELIDSDD